MDKKSVRKSVVGDWYSNIRAIRFQPFSTTLEEGGEAVYFTYCKHKSAHASQAQQGSERVQDYAEATWVPTV